MKMAPPKKVIPIRDPDRPGHVLQWREREGYYASIPDPDLYPSNDGVPGDDELMDLVLEAE